MCEWRRTFIRRACSGTGAIRRIGVGSLVCLWGLTGGLRQQLGDREEATRTTSPQRATKANPAEAVKDLGRAILATVPFAAAAFRRRAQRFSARHALGLTFGSVCLVGAAICDVRIREAEFLWRPIEAYSRHPGLFLSWLHWFSYALMGGGALAFVAGPVAMLVDACYTDLPSLEKTCAEKVGAQAFREQQRTVSAFWPIKYSNRYISDRRLYETVPVMVREKDANGSPLLGEWVVEHELRPWTDKLLGRLRDKSDVTLMMMKCQMP